MLYEWYQKRHPLVSPKKTQRFLTQSIVLQSIPGPIFPDTNYEAIVQRGMKLMSSENFSLCGPE